MNQRKSSRRGIVMVALAALAGFTAPVTLHAQKVQPGVKTGNLELGLFAGESYGLDRFRPMGGANIAYGWSRMLFPFAEASYLPGILRRQTIQTGATSSNREFSINMTDVHFGLHLRLPRPESRVVPYAVGGVGLVHGGKSSATYYNVSPFGSVDAITQSVPSSTNFTFDFGGGLRFFFTETLAIRVEF